MIIKKQVKTERASFSAATFKNFNAINEGEEIKRVKNLLIYFKKIQNFTSVFEI